MERKWKVVTGLVGGFVLFHIIDEMVYGWFADDEALDCFKEGTRDGREVLNTFFSNPNQNDIPLLQPTNVDGMNNCEKAYEHGYAIGVTLPAASPVVSALVAWYACSSRQKTSTTRPVFA